MWWRISRAEFSRNGNRGNRRALRTLVRAGTVPGMLAYRGGEPVAWVSLGPREDFAALERSTTLKRVDDQPVWSVVCFFVAKPYRGRGVMAPLLRAAVAYARRRGARLIEGYPIDPGDGLTGYAGFTGVVSAFRRAGFRQVARPTPRQYVMRLKLR